MYWNQLPDANFMDTGPPTLVGDLQVLPFFLWADGSPESGRKYSSKTFDTSLVVTCITCHDPHGTSLVYENYEEHGEHTEGMLRIFMTTVDYSDPLCGQCHSE